MIVSAGLRNLDVTDESPRQTVATERKFVVSAFLYGVAIHVLSCMYFLNNSFSLAETPESIPTCNVNGKIYKDGEYFTVEDEPDLTCTCQPGYEGKMIIHKYTRWKILITFL